MPAQYFAMLHADRNAHWSDRPDFRALQGICGGMQNRIRRQVAEITVHRKTIVGVRGGGFCCSSYVCDALSGQANANFGHDVLLCICTIFEARYPATSAMPPLPSAPAWSA